MLFYFTNRRQAHIIHAGTVRQVVGVLLYQTRCRKVKHRPWGHSPISLEQSTLDLKANHTQTNIWQNPAQDQQELILEINVTSCTPRQFSALACFTSQGTLRIRCVQLLFWPKGRLQQRKARREVWIGCGKRINCTRGFPSIQVAFFPFPLSSPSLRTLQALHQALHLFSNLVSDPGSGRYLTLWNSQYAP